MNFRDKLQSCVRSILKVVSTSYKVRRSDYFEDDLELKIHRRCCERTSKKHVTNPDSNHLGYNVTGMNVDGDQSAQNTSTKLGQRTTNKSSEFVQILYKE